MTSTHAEGGVTDDPIRVGTMLYTLVEPHRGHQVEYNRWYERDHFYAGCQIGAYNFAGARFVATAPLKKLRFPEASPAVGPEPLVADPEIGSYLGLYFVLDGHHDEWNRWAVDQVNALHAAGRMFDKHDHIHTGLYHLEWEHRREADGVPAELTLDHRFPGMVSVFVEPTEGATPERIGAWFRDEYLPSVVPGSPVATVLAFSPLPLLADAPGDVPRSESVDQRVLLIYFLDEEPSASWDAVFAGQGEAVAASGLGHVLWASPFIGAVPGTDTYTDQLWSDPGLMPDFIGELAARTEAHGWVGAPTLWELIERRAAATPDAVLAHEDTGKELTFAGYRDACLRAAAGLYTDYGVSRNTAVSWELPTWNESLVLVGALARLGAQQNPLIPIYRSREVGFITAQSQASLLIVPTIYRGFDFEAMALEIAGDRLGLSVLVVDRALPDGDPDDLPEVEPAPATAAEAPVRWLFYTSGTTADPKGAPHSDLTVMASALAMAECLDIRDDDVSALVFPFTHIGGIGWLIASLLTGCTLLITEAFDPIKTPAFLAENQVTLAGSGTPFHLAYLAAQRAKGDEPLFPAIRSYPGGGAPKPPQLHHDLKREVGGVGIVSGYGLTEAPIVVMATSLDPDQKLADTEGRPTPGVELIVVGLDGTRAGPGEEGEIRLKGPQVIRGYLDPSLDAEAFDDEGYFRSGDLGVVDADGFVTITGRLKDVIIRHGENISAKEVEDLLYGHPAVADVAVIGLPDPKTGERAYAVVAVNQGEAFTFEDMVSYLRGHDLRLQAIPEQLELVDSVPRNPAGKILKHKLRETFAPSTTGRDQ